MRWPSRRCCSAGSRCVNGWRPTPLVPSRVLRVPGLVAANAVQFLMVCAYFGFQFLLAVELQLVLGLDAAAPAGPSCPPRS